MALNPDPKPGRWILPLVVLGMVAFTYFFVRELPSGDVTAGESTTSTSVPGEADEPDATTSTSAPVTAADPAAQAYLDGVATILTTTTELQAEMAAVNGGFDAEPPTVEYDDAVNRLGALGDQADALVADIDALTPPESLSTNHETIRTAITTSAGAADEALDGLQSTDDGSQRRDAVAAFDQAVADLQTAVDNARSAAGLAATPDTPPDTTPQTPPDTTTGTAPDTTEAG